MAKISQQSIADQLSIELGFPVTRAMVREWQKKNYDLVDLESLREKLGEQERPPVGMQVDEFETPPVTETEIEGQISQLKEQLLAALDKKSAETIGIKIRGLRGIQAMLIEQGRYILKEEAMAAGMQAGLASRGAWERIEDDLPPQLEGLTALAMKKKLRDYARSISKELSEHFSE